MSAQDDTATETNVTIIPGNEPLQPMAEPPPVVEEVKQEQVETPAEEVADEGQESNEPERDEKGKFKPKLQDRIDELTKARGTAEREAAYWKGVAEAAKPQKAATDDAEPKVEDFDDYSAYVKASVRYEAKQLIKAETQTFRQEQAQAAKATTWQQRTEAAKAAMPDFAEVLSGSQAPMTQAMAEVLQESEHGPALAYHLAKNPADAERIAHLSPLAQARELGKIEATLSAPKEAPAPKKVTSAPPPPTPIGSGRSTTGDPGKMSQADYMAWRQTVMRN